MEYSTTWSESLPSNRIKAIQELTHGQEEWRNKLQEALWWPENMESDPTSSMDGVVVQVLGMFEKSISMMGSWSFSNEIVQLPTSDLHSSVTLDKPKLENFDDSPKTVIPVKVKKRCAKRRKNSANVTSVLIDDGHSWRKYGQKDIINAKHHRSYYRCTYKSDQGCIAAKQIQKIEDEPPKYKITYSGKHTCNNLERAPAIILDSQDSKDTSIILNFETNELIAKKQLRPNFPSMKQELKDDQFPFVSSLGHNHNDQSWDPLRHVSQVQKEPVSLISSWLDHEEIVSPWAYFGLDHEHIISS